MLASLLLSSTAILTKNVLPSVNDSIWVLGYYNNLNACVLLLPHITLAGEVPTILGYVALADGTFWLTMATGGVFGLCIGYVTTLQIQATSPLTHNISGTAKACTQTVLATYWYGQSKPLLWWVSNLTVLVASAAYTRFRQVAMRHAHQIQRSRAKQTYMAP